MSSFVSSLRAFVMIVAAAMLVSGPVQAEEPATAAEASAEPWQDVISGQIEAFRGKDAPGAFQYAGAGFKVVFPTAEQFFLAILQAGYMPIMDSRSHSFGEFQLVGETGVVQKVRFVGNDQSLYEAYYQLAREDDGWRVQGVQLIKQNAIGV